MIDQQRYDEPCTKENPCFAHGRYVPRPRRDRIPRKEWIDGSVGWAVVVDRYSLDLFWEMYEFLVEWIEKTDTEFGRGDLRYLLFQNFGGKHLIRKRSYYIGLSANHEDIAAAVVSDMARHDLIRCVRTSLHLAGGHRLLWRRVLEI